MKLCLLWILTVSAAALAPRAGAQEEPSVRDLAERVKALESRVPSAPAVGEPIDPEERARLHDTLAEKKFWKRASSYFPA